MGRNVRAILEYSHIVYAFVLINVTMSYDHHMGCEWDKGPVWSYKARILQTFKLVRHIYLFKTILHIY